MTPSPLTSALRSPTPLAGATFSGEDGLDLAVTGRQLTECIFEDCRFEGLTVTASTFVGCQFRHCSFTDTTFTDCAFIGEGEAGPCRWSFSRLDEVRFLRCNLNLNSFSKGSMAHARLEACTASGLVFDCAIRRTIAGRRGRGGGITFADCRLLYARFQERDLAGADFEGSDLRDTDFTGVDLSGGNLRRTRLSNAEFGGATLDNADLCGADFDSFNLAELRSFQGMVISADQQAMLLAAVGIRVGG